MSLNSSLLRFVMSSGDSAGEDDLARSAEKLEGTLLAWFDSRSVVAIARIGTKGGTTLDSGVFNNLPYAVTSDAEDK
jgi:hypothetical protein